MAEQLTDKRGINLRHIWYFFFIFSLFVSLNLTGNCYALTGKININTATAKELKELPFIGASKARAIIKYRQKHGPFSDLSDLKEIPVIGDSTLQAITPYLRISGQTNIKRDEPKSRRGATVFPKIKTSPGQIIMLPDTAYYPALMSAIRLAKKNITITMFIFKITKSPKNRPSLLLKELIAASKRGVDISITLDKSNYDEGINKENNKVAKRLRRHHIKVRLDSDKRTTHAKIVVVDNRFCFLGSHNLTHSALTYNNEYTLLIDSKSLAHELQRYTKQIK